jgi:hypothetical protein
VAIAHDYHSGSGFSNNYRSLQGITRIKLISKLPNIKVRKLGTLLVVVDLLYKKFAAYCTVSNFSSNRNPCVGLMDNIHSPIHSDQRNVKTVGAKVDVFDVCYSVVVSGKIKQIVRNVNFSLDPGDLTALMVRTVKINNQLARFFIYLFYLLYLTLCCFDLGITGFFWRR